MARTDLLKRRELCQALFYGACCEREAGDNAACMDKMQACAHLENPIIEVEWYLALGECRQNGGMAAPGQASSENEDSPGSGLL